MRKKRGEGELHILLLSIPDIFFFVLTKYYGFNTVSCIMTTVFKIVLKYFSFPGSCTCNYKSKLNTGSVKVEAELNNDTDLPDKSREQHVRNFTTTNMMSHGNQSFPMTNSFQSMLFTLSFLNILWNLRKKQNIVFKS